MCAALDEDTPRSWLIYHPRRERRVLGGRVVHCDSNQGNQDPYLWTERFLHTYCHMSQFHANVGGIHLWVSGDTFPAFSHLYCDLVFVVGAKCYWDDSNHITPEDPIVDSVDAFHDHYRWHTQHPYARRRRFTLKADAERSFQPHNDDGELIDIVSLLAELGLPLVTLQAQLRVGVASKPMQVSTATAASIAEMLGCRPKLTGHILRKIRQNHPELAS